MKILILPTLFLMACEITSPSLSDLKEVDGMMSQNKPKLCYETFVDKESVILVDERSVCNDGSKPIPVYFLWETNDKICTINSPKKYIKKEFGCMKFLEKSLPPI